MKNVFLFFKKYLWHNLILFLLIFIPYLKIEAQSNLCDDIPYNVSVYQNFGITQSAPPISTTTIKVYFMVYRDNDGSNGVSNQRLQDIMDRLNTNYQSAGFAFVWRLCETIYTNDTELNNSTNSCIFEEIHTDGLNIHVRGDSKPHRARVNSIPGTVVFVGGTFTINQNSTFIGDVPSATNSIVHEVGHCLGLFHTHHGSCASEVPTSMCPSDINSMISSNGDMVDDTPRDPNLEEKMIINSCTWNEDKCEDNMNIPITNPLTNNFMSYTRPTCMTSFTAGQITRMQALCPSNIKYNGPTGVPTLSGDEVSNQCPVRAFDLNTLVNSLLPCGAEVRWSTDSGPLNSISPIVSNLVSQTGFYYAYYYYADENSYGPASQPVYFFKNKCCGDLEDLIITSNTDIILNQDMGNIKVKSGYTLTIKSKLQFAEDKGIEVEYGAKLIIDGGTLTKCPLVASWKGIKVQGDLSYIWGFGQPTTEVIVKNAGSIEYAYIAINAVSQITFFTTTDIGGAKITINGNSIISHCNIGVKLGPIYGLNDLSSIDDATFSNNDKAILLSGNNGLKVSNSVFDHNAMDIEGGTSSLIADHNVFNGGVLMDAEYPTYTGSTFINNEFFDDVTIGALSNATDFIIQNNQFLVLGYRLLVSWILTYVIMIS
ncbi:MAG: hypothetical protein IPO92_10645 [Saprospiraceae bacterium]|nr:hypothetical protein [Saprospiraceae bacterium]